jgi:hypothetical protein
VELQEMLAAQEASTKNITDRNQRAVRKTQIQAMRTKLDELAKESNELEDVEAGMVSPDQAYTQFTDKRRDFWSTKVRPSMRLVSIQNLATATGLSRRMLIDARLGKRRPHLKHRQRIAAVLIRLGVLTP